MLVQVGGVSEGFAAVLAFVGFFACMEPFVLLQGPSFGKGFMAEITGERFFAFMPPEMGLVGVFV